MTVHEASRTLVKSLPELWTQCSDAASLSRHLEQFGEIRITRLEPETTVAWEGELASGTVRLEPAGWGTKVVVTARPRAIAPAPATAALAPVIAPPEPVIAPPEPVIAAPDPAEPAPAPAEPAPAPEPVKTAPPPPAPEANRRGVFARMARLFARRRPLPVLAEPPRPAAREGAAPPPAAGEGAAPPPAALEPVAPEPVPAPAPDPLADADAALAAALDSFGQAHHRPFSRA